MITESNLPSVPPNMFSMVVTLPVFQSFKPEISDKFLQPLNIYAISVTLLVFHCSKPFRVFTLWQFLNKLLILVTLLTSNASILPGDSI